MTFWDTANVYQQGSSEEIVGRAIQRYARREDIVLATKVSGRAGDEKDDSWLGVPMVFGGINWTPRGKRSPMSDSTSNMEVVEEDEGDRHLVRFVWFIAKKSAGGLPGVADPER